MRSKLLYGIVLHLIYSVFCLQVNAQTIGDTFTENGILYEVTLVGIPNEVSTTDYTGANNTVTIPATITDTSSGFNYSVTAIGDAAFDSNSLTSVTIPNSVISIGDYAFGDNELTSVTIPNSVISIGNYAFWTNDLLTSITFGNQLTSIGYAAFRECSLINVDIPDSVTSISTTAFLNNGTIQSVTLSSSLNVIGGTVFGGNPNLTKVISKSLTPVVLPATTFNNSNNDIDLTIPGSAKTAYTNAAWTGFKSINVYIPDANFKAALVADTAINTDANTEISFAEATAFTGLMSVFNKSISDLTGIEAFINVTELNCNANQLTVLDVSANTALIGLGVSANQLTSLDVSQNTALTSLYCSDNQLTNLDVSANTALERLYCEENQLSSLDVSTNTPLIFLFCFTNQLTSLNIANGNNSNISNLEFDATNNPNLTCIQVDDVAYSAANWTNIDASASFSTNCGNTASIVDNEFNNAISIYPNPIQNTLNVSLATGDTLKSVQVFNLLGKKVVQTTSAQVNLSNVSKGIYIVKVENTEGKIAIRKVIKE